ncbi:hypothetical protein FEM48_Zijuj09G0176400 [Ziziphus jujuba var. spinosa]|uniref:Uncharacterized protein n=1 Tax=Ziziphus jujuba var. spinosa TaxID=714518 RepID=A0A978UUD5_ZIZJJ|nr:hypothetical protein FEM48_Zijuj09G0176400 [Ziziphus jujuba var. spinosa]
MIMGGNETINQGSHWVTYETAFPTFENCRKDDTHSYTFQLLEANSYFGMEPTQVKLLKQEKVACLDDNDARLTLDPHNRPKPHSHGDVHSLLYSSGLLNYWNCRIMKRLSQTITIYGTDAFHYYYGEQTP